jgi:tetratricopeptide (TPR) repeat protein
MLLGCQTAPPLSTEQQVTLALGVAQSARADAAEILLQKAYSTYAAAHNTLGEARTLLALGELYKSKPWQDLQTPPATINSYIQAADHFANAAERYQQLNQPALEAAAYVGQANAYLLADQLPHACQSFEHAQRLATDPRIAQDPTRAAALERSLRFFADLTVVCVSQPR